MPAASTAELTFFFLRAIPRPTLPAAAMVDASNAQPSAAGDATIVEDLPAVFWDEMPTNKDNVDLAAINALIDEQTPVERAESHKVHQLDLDVT